MAPSLDSSAQISKRVLISSVRDFVVPVDPSGDLGMSFGLAVAEDALNSGTAAHTRIQRRLGREHDDFRKEVSLSHTFELSELTILVRGKLDCLFAATDTTPPIIEEIKSSFRVDGLMHALEHDHLHPYILQAYTYAWLYTKTNGVIPRCRLRVVSLLDDSETLLELDFQFSSFNQWVESQCLALAEREKAREARMQARRELATTLHFPFPEARPGQNELMATVAEAIANEKHLLVQAPTGLGKTAAIMFPTLLTALQNDKTVFYVTPRNSQHRIAEEFIRRMRDLTFNVTSVTIRAKEKMCPKDEVDCRPDVCEFAKGYYDRLKSSGAIEKLLQIGCVSSDDIGQIAAEYTLCPFELSLDTSQACDVVICDYNYVFAPRATLIRHFGNPDQAAQNLVIVDEAHNLQSRACGWFSPSLSHMQLAELRPRQSLIEDKKLRSRLSRIHKELRTLLSSLEGESRLVTIPNDEFFALEGKLGKLLSDALAQGERLTPNDPAVRLFHLIFDLSEVLRAWGPQFFAAWKPTQGFGTLEVVCADASKHLGERLRQLPAFVGFSATLKPFEFNATLLGIRHEKLQMAEFLSPFPTTNRKLLVVPQISTAWRDREWSVPKIAEIISRILPLRIGNYIVFFPSFDFMNNVLQLVTLPDFEVLAQPRSATSVQIDCLLAALNEKRNIALFAVQGGSLAEGIDCPGDALIGAVVVGPPLPTFDVSREAMRGYYHETYGRGREFAYVYPAMARAVQAAGRVIRSAGDRGLVLLLDKRFLWDDFAQCMPVDWYCDTPKELVSNALLRDVSEFWTESP